MDKIRFSSENVHKIANKMSRCSDHMDDGIHELHYVISLLENYEDSRTVQELLEKLEGMMRNYRSLQDRSYHLGKALNKVCTIFEANEKKLIANAGRFQKSAFFLTDGINTFLGDVYARRKYYIKYQKDIEKALDKLEIQEIWIRPAVFIPQWLACAADNYGYNRQNV
ncbi:MAG: hypothetical protein IJ719_00420 [Clostridia bacterium]|nr:hypothetical protein [Clostridia bacterium]